MNNDNYDSLKLGNKNDDGQSVLISDLADRPNAFNSYRESKLSAADLKAIFDRSFLHVKSRFNNLIDVLKKRDQKVEEVYEAYKSGKLKGDKGDKGDSYIMTDDDRAEIADMVEVEIIGDINEALDRIIAIQNDLIDDPLEKEA